MGPLARRRPRLPLRALLRHQVEDEDLGKTPVWRLPRELKLAFLRAVARMFSDFFEALGRLAAAHHKARLLVQEYREELAALGLLDEDG